jgi:hypothetical protein
MKIDTLLPFFIGLCFSCCIAPSPVLRLQPEQKENNSEWFWGRQYIKQEAAGLEMALAFEDT